jgi:hypothetical protein
MRCKWTLRRFLWTCVQLRQHDCNPLLRNNLVALRVSGMSNLRNTAGAFLAGAPARAQEQRIITHYVDTTYEAPLHCAASLARNLLKNQQSRGNVAQRLRTWGCKGGPLLIVVGRPSVQGLKHNLLRALLLMWAGCLRRGLSDCFTAPEPPCNAHRDGGVIIPRRSFSPKAAARAPDRSRALLPRPRR